VELEDQIKNLRKGMGLSQRKLAAQAGVSYSYIQLLEAGKRKDISLTVARKLATVFGKDPEIFLKNTESPVRSLSAIMSELQQRIIETESSDLSEGWVMIPLYEQKAISSKKGIIIKSKAVPVDLIAVSITGNERMAYAITVTHGNLAVGVLFGDTVILDHDKQPKNGSLVAVMIDGVFNIRHFSDFNGVQTLDPDNIPFSDVCFCGEVIEIRREITAERILQGKKDLQNCLVN